MDKKMNIWVFETRQGQQPQWNSVAYNAEMTSREVDQCEIQNGNKPMAVWGPYDDFEEAEDAIKDIAEEL